VSSPFRDFPIRRKLLFMAVATTALALVFASGGFVIWDVYQFTEELQRNLSTRARLVADLSEPVVVFEQPTQETIQPLQVDANIGLVCLYAVKDAEILARLERAGRCPDRAPAPEDVGFWWTYVEELQPVWDRTGKDVVGWLYIQRGLLDVFDRLRVGGVTVLGLLLLAIAAAFVISSRLGGVIAAPLLDLAQTADRISSTRDYSLRAVPLSNDETGVVVRAVNDMLDRIGERTLELSKANAELEREVEERKRVEAERTAALERERDANRLKDEFLATLSHELRTPLNAVLGWARVLRTARVDDATRARALDSIERNAKAQARLIEDLLEVSRIVTGKLRLQIDTVDLAAIVDAAVEVVQPAATAKRLVLVTRIEVRPALTVADADRLQQVVWNLLSNAVKFTPADGSITIALQHRDGYLLTVQDSGPGIDARFLPHMFEPFRQADGSASREHGGLGLGLAIAKRLVEMHGGTIRASGQSGEGVGATFEVHLPSAVDPSAAAPGASTPEATLQAMDAGTTLQDLRVLVVDDEEDARGLLEAALTTYGASVATAASVPDALQEIERRPPDVVLSDIGMPIEDGYALIRRLRARPAEAGGGIPAIAITAYASPRDRSLAEASGYQAHISKPFEPEDVVRAIARVIADRDGRSALDAARGG
jgi:signal transduction histidine kinase/ActR/RegA family two-component response regulator